MSKPPSATSSTFDTERPLTAQRLAQYVARRRCERHMRYTLFPSEAKRQLARFRLEFEPLSPLLSGEGQRFEREMVEELAARGVEVRDMTNADAAHFVAEVTRQRQGRAPRRPSWTSRRARVRRSASASRSPSTRGCSRMV